MSSLFPQFFALPASVVYFGAAVSMDTAEWGYTVPIFVLNGSVINAETADAKSSTPLEALRYHEENIFAAGCF